MDSFNAKLSEYINITEDALENYLKQTDEKYDYVIEAMRYSVMNGGKRIRPVLLLEFCRLNNGDINAAIAFACAVEMIHCSSLIHDDMPCMDDDDLRRGVPTCHKKFGEATALLAGDALITLAFDIISRDDVLNKLDAKTIVKATNVLANLCGINGMMGGQAIDLDYEDKQIDYETLKQMHRLKTSALIKTACVLGVIVAKNANCDIISWVASKSEEEKTHSFDAIKNAKIYAENLGLAFQVTDDILDVTGDEDILGKPIGSDEENNKATYVTLFGVDKAKEIAKEHIQNAVNSLKVYEQNEFIISLTESLLNRKK